MVHEIRVICHCHAVALSPMRKDAVYPANIVVVQMRPIEGVYIISTEPQMKPPPTQVAVGGTWFS